MTLSRRCTETLIDLVEIKLSCLEITDREDQREKELLQRCVQELHAELRGENGCAGRFRRAQAPRPPAQASPASRTPPRLTGGRQVSAASTAAAGCMAGASRGSRMVKRVPCPGQDWTETVPPSGPVTVLNTMCRPSPDPP